MADKTQVDSGDVAIARAKDFWTRNSKAILIVCGAIILLGGGWLVYKNFFKNPKEITASEAMFKAEEYYRMDSINKALNGDGPNAGFLKVISKYSGTSAANMAHFYAGSCYLKLGDNQNAIKHLKKFDGKAKQVQARAYKLLGDAYADSGNAKEGLSYYKKAGRYFEEDELISAESLFMAAYLADRVLKDTKEATDLYKELKEKYPSSPEGREADKYLAQLGVDNIN